MSSGMRSNWAWKPDPDVRLALKRGFAVEKDAPKKRYDTPAGGNSKQRSSRRKS